MSKSTTVLEETTDRFDSETGEITQQTKRTVKKSNIKETDEYIKVSRYLHTIFAFNNIPLNLVPFSMLIAEFMTVKTNEIHLDKYVKDQFAKMLDISLDHVNTLIKRCKKHNIIRPKARGVYEVNSYLFSTGDLVNTRKLQAHFDCMTGEFLAIGEQENLLTGTTIRKAVKNYKDKQIDGQMRLPLDMNEGL